MSSIEIKNCEGVSGKRIIANGNSAMFILGVAVGVVATIYVLNRIGKKNAQELASTANDVIQLSNYFKAAS